jgi:hypothetical protein
MSTEHDAPELRGGEKAADPREIIDRAMCFNMEMVVNRYAKEEELPIEVAREHERELKRYLALCALKTDGFYGMRGPIDNLWHTFVTFTKPYFDFCDRVGSGYIHHFPNVPIEEGATTGERGTNIADAYKQFLCDYESYFGEVAPAHLWPRPMPTESSEYQGAGCGCGCRCIA